MAHLHSAKRNTIIGLTAATVFLLLVGNFIYRNVVVPWPYRHQLRECLDNAQNHPDQELIDEQRNQCFRTYPHFL